MPSLHAHTRLRTFAVLGCLALLASVGATAQAQTSRQTTAGGTLVPGGDLDPAKPGFLGLTTGPPSKLAVRQLPSAEAQSGRLKRRMSLSYFAYLTDIHVADEESPARFDSLGPAQVNSSAWRPQEALQPQTVNAEIRHLNAFAAASPNAGARGRRAATDLALLGGDQADNQQENELTWVRQLLEGGQVVDPNSGISDYSSCTSDQQRALNLKPLDEAARYTGIQDYSDYNDGRGDPNIYDPDRPSGAFSAWPQYAGLMDFAQKPFFATGLRNGTAPVPTYLTAGNHDSDAQGYFPSTAPTAQLATGCSKPYMNATLSPPATGSSYAVPPDPRRRFVGPNEAKRIFAAGGQSDAHGFGFVDAAQDAAAAGSASYYAWSPKPRLRFISLDTVAEGNEVKGGAEGNIDEPQYQWLRGELRRAKAAKQVVVVFGHHPIRRLLVKTSDEAAGPCSSVTTGCDSDPRRSTPIRLGADLVKLFNANANVVAYLAGHTHTNRIRPCASRCSKTGNWWAIETTSSSDFPQQQRLMEVMDNRDGTLSVLGTPVDHAGSIRPPDPTADPGATGAFTVDQLAGLSRTLSANDPRRYRNPAGGAGDRNVELIVRDPRAGKGAGLCAVAVNRVSGHTADRSVLGRKRTLNRKAYPKASLKAKSAAIDRFCLVGGANARSGYPTTGLLESLTRGERRRVSGRTVLSVTSAKTTKVQGIKVGSPTSSVARRLRNEKRYTVGTSVFFLAPASKSRILIQVRRGKVVQLGLADKKLTASATGAKRYLSALF
ncbi:MAG: metallophosphoesterase family protein [Thermoleophilaceae bacterium]